MDDEFRDLNDLRSFFIVDLKTKKTYLIRSFEAVEIISNLCFFSNRMNGNIKFFIENKM